MRSAKMEAKRKEWTKQFSTDVSSCWSGIEERGLYRENRKQRIIEGPD